MYNGQFFKLGAESRNNLVFGNIGEHAEGSPVLTAGVRDEVQDNVVFGNIAF